MRNDTFTGVWWLPDDPNRQVAGTLITETSRNPRLELIGSFGEPTSMNALVRHPVVLGMTTSGQRVTLVEPYVAGSTFHAPGFFVEVLVGRAAVINAHFETLDDMVATTVYASFTWLPEWVGWGNMKESVKERTIQFEFKPPEFPLHRVGNEQIGLASGWTTTGKSRARARTIEPKYTLKVVGNDSMESLIERRVRPFENLLSLASGHPNVTVAIEFRTDRGEMNQTSSGTAELIYPVTPPEPLRRDPIPHDMLFSYQTVQEEFGELIRGWYRVHEDLDVVCALFFSTLRNGGPQEVQFLNLVRALEVYDRLRNNNQVRLPGDHGALLERILDEHSGDDREWLERRLEYSNEPSLRQRLKRLVAEVPGLLEPIAGRPGPFVTLVSTSRNYYTHYDSSLKDHAAIGADLYFTVERLRVLLSALLLLASGMRADRIASLFSANQHYIWLQRKYMGIED